MLYVLLGILSGIGISIFRNLIWSKRKFALRTIVTVCSSVLVFCCFGYFSTWSSVKCQ